MNEEPLIYTSKGNLPVKDLEMHGEWEDCDEYVKFTEIYTLAGDVVRQSVHVMVKKARAAGSKVSMRGEKIHG
jgi:hypothetical protein